MKSMQDSASKIQPIRCITAFGTLVFSHNSTLSIVGNRFLLPDAQDLTLRTYQSVCFRYDQQLSFWTVLTAPIGAIASSTANTIVKWLNQAEFANSSISDTGSLVSTPLPIAANGGITITGQYTFLGRQVFSIAGTYTPTTGARVVKIRECGGGGGGGGAKTGAAGGGSSGAYVEQVINPGATITGGTVTIGAAGTGGAITPTAGSAGGTTSIVIQSITYTAMGGKGSLACGAIFCAGVDATGGSTAADVNQFMPGTQGTSNAGATIGVSGAGGSSPFGGGEIGRAHV